jgi:hypothetical protein
MYVRIFTVSGGLLIGALSAVSQTPKTLNGTVTDTMCGAKHMMTNVSAAQCARECVKGGSEFALISGGKIYALKGDAKQIDKYAGQNVTVTGDVSGSTVKVRSISAAKS